MAFGSNLSDGREVEVEDGFLFQPLGAVLFADADHLAQDLHVARVHAEDGQRLEARILEASLRDEIRGGDLMAPSTRGAVEAARRRGVQVSMLDEGGLACLAEAQREPLWLKIAEVIAGIESGRVTVRSPIGERWVVTIAAFSEGENRPQVWLRLAADGAELS
mgnify:CR=1 FL=1